MVIEGRDGFLSTVRKISFGRRFPAHVGLYRQIHHLVFNRVEKGVKNDFVSQFSNQNILEAAI